MPKHAKHFGNPRAKPDKNYPVILNAYKMIGAAIWESNIPFDLFVKWPADAPRDQIHHVDAKGLDGSPTKLEALFEKIMGPGSIEYARTRNEAYFIVGYYTPPYEFSVEVSDFQITVKLWNVMNGEKTIIPVMGQVARMQKEGVGTMSGRDNDEWIIFPRKGIKVDSLRKRIYEFLDYTRIGVEGYEML